MHKSTTLLSSVTRRAPELVAPTKPTPRGLKPLSDIDDQEGLRVFVTAIHIYAGDTLGNTRDPVRVIREALADAMVFYYPLAGRLREAPGRKLVVDCTGEGAVFVEADAHFTVADLGRDNGGFPRPPFPRELCDVPSSSPSDILNCPVLLIQVTRFRCGGFSFTLRVNHAMCDAIGIVQFERALGELARGSSQPSVEPVWSRELLLARDPPRGSCTHREYDQVVGTIFPIQYANDRVIEQSFFFGHAELSAIQSHLPPTLLKQYGTINLLSAFLWRCRTLAQRFNPHEEVRFFYVVNVRQILNPPLPEGYYGNAIVSPAASSTARELTSNDLYYAVELIKNAKAKVTEEYVRSWIDLLATQDRPPFTVPGSWSASDNYHVRFDEVDFGWGRPVYGGTATPTVGSMPGSGGFLMKGNDEEGESGVLLMICLPETAMERFAKEVKSVIKGSTRISKNHHPKL